MAGFPLSSLYGFMKRKGWLAIAKLKPLSLFISLLLMLKKALDNVKKKEIESESGFSFAIASQPLEQNESFTKMEVCM